MQKLLNSCIIFLCAVISITLTDNNKPCITPFNERGTCKPLKKCNHLFTHFKKSKTDAFLRKSHCGFVGSYPKVCCPNQVKTGVLENCGLYEQNFENRIYGGSNTELGEFPWMALLEYENLDGSKSFQCAGILISRRHVLTAAHCAYTFTGSLINVRLGEHNMSSDPDCISDTFGKFCSDTPIDVGIEKIFSHENYRFSHKHNDIAVLKLKKDVIFTDYIKPICLPLSAENDKSYVNENLIVVGWGKNERHVAMTGTKLKIALPVVDLSICSKSYNKVGKYLKTSQICAGGHIGKDSCRGDSGGPLMKLIKKDGIEYWILIGIVSYGRENCGTNMVPGVYTKVSKFNDWILDKIVLQ